MSSMDRLPVVVSFTVICIDQHLLLMRIADAADDVFVIQSVKLLISDFDNAAVKPTYKYAHVFFTEGLTSQCIS